MPTKVVSLAELNLDFMLLGTTQTGCQRTVDAANEMPQVVVQQTVGTVVDQGTLTISLYWAYQ